MKENSDPVPCVCYLNQPEKHVTKADSKVMVGLLILGKVQDADPKVYRQKKMLHDWSYLVLRPGT